MIVKDLIDYISRNNVPKDAELIVYVTDEEGYRPFTNVNLKYYGKTCAGTLNELDLSVNINKEFKSANFPNNKSKEEVFDLLLEYNSVCERELELKEELGAYVDISLEELMD